MSGEARTAAAEVYPIIRDLIDFDDCWFDHNGGCQAHGYLNLQPGELCPNEDAKRWLEKWKEFDL